MVSSNHIHGNKICNLSFAMEPKWMTLALNVNTIKNKQNKHKQKKKSIQNLNENLQRQTKTLTTTNHIRLCTIFILSNGQCRLQNLDRCWISHSIVSECFYINIFDLIFAFLYFKHYTRVVVCLYPTVLNKSEWFCMHIMYVYIMYVHYICCISVTIWLLGMRSAG